MKLVVITSNIFFGESLKSLLENYGFTKDRYVILTDVTSENIEELKDTKHIGVAIDTLLRA